jgi:type I restriction enzyme S subunit
MGLTKLGKYIVPLDSRNTDNLYNEDAVVGLSTQKMMISTKADLTGVNLTSYKLMPPGSFAYVPDTSRRGNKMSLAFNSTNNTYLVSSISIVFMVNKPDELISDYLFMYFNRPEFDRYSRFNSWGSARETFSWDDMCDIDIELPPVPIQQKYVDVYNSMVANQQCYERGLEDLKLACDATIEEIRKTVCVESIIPYIVERQERNVDMLYDELVGVGNEGFITPRGQRDESTFYKCNIFYPRDFVYNPSVISKGAIAFNTIYNTPRICTEEYVVFYVKNEEILTPEYLFLWLKREETGRFLDFMNIDSVRNRVYFRDLENIHIPIPDIDTQRMIAKMYLAYNERKEINEILKAQIKDICPILIKGSLDEASA